MRGAFNAISHLPAHLRDRGVVTASGGNHGLAVAYTAQAAGIPATGLSVGAMMGLWFADEAPTNLTQAQSTDLDRFRKYHGLMLARGVHLPPSPFEAWFVSLAHDEEIVERILAAHRDALAAL